MLPTPTFEMIQASVYDRNQFGAGSAARFVRVNADWGFKYYSKLWLAELVVMRQFVAYELGFAPALDLKIHTVRQEFENGCRYGYLTEMCHCPSWHDPKDEMEQNEKTYLVLIQHLRDLGFPMILGDIRETLNWGYRVSDRKPVVYDYSYWPDAPEGLGDEYLKTVQM